jgi:hypothetical protein
MKRILLSILTVASFGATTNAQITIDNPDLMSIGDELVQAIDTIPGSITIGSSGASQTWNYSTLNEHILDSLSFQDPAPLLGSTSFPNSNIGLTRSQTADLYYFLTKDAAGFYFDGVYMNLFPTSVVPVNQTMLTFPSTMGTTFNESFINTPPESTVGFDPDGPGPLLTVDAIKVISNVTVNSTIDGWGDITTPIGTFGSLRQTVVEEKIDSIYIMVLGVWSAIPPLYAQAMNNISPVEYDTIRTARWWNNDVVLMEMDYEMNGTVNKVTWHKSNNINNIGLEENNVELRISLYPNPTSSQITIDSEEMIEEVTIFNICGELVQQEVSATFSVSTLSNGVYVMNIQTNNGIVRSRFIKE